MSHRLGVCSSCDAKYKIPASFTASQAKCKACGGVVNISDSEESKPAAAPPVPARKVAPAPTKPASPQLEEVRGSGKRREGPSMKERLLAQRRADAEPEAPASKPAAPAARRAQPAARPAKSRSTARAAAAESKEERPSSRPSRAGAGAKGGSSRRSGARAGRRGGSSDDDGDEDASPRRGSRPRKKNSMMPALVAIALLVLTGVGAFLYMNQDTAPQAASNEGGTADDQVAANDGGAAAETTDAATSDAADASEAPAAEASDASDASAANGDGATEEAPADAEKPAEKPKKPASSTDPDSVDLTAIEDFGPVDGMTDEEFAEVTELAQLMIDPEAGAAGNRARSTLTEMGRQAFPALMNEFKRLDFSTQQGYQDGDVIQATLRDICKGKSFGWKYTTDSADVYYNKRTVQNWASNWRVAQSDMVRWEAMTKQSSTPEAKPAEEPEEKPGGIDTDDLDDLDDL